MALGLKPAVTPAGKPLAERVIAELNPPEMAAVIVDFPEPPGATVTAVGVAESANPGALLEPIVRLTLAVSFSPPPLPVMVTV